MNTPIFSGSWLSLLIATSFFFMVPRAHSGEFALKESLTLHASFDHGIDADAGSGSRTLYTAPNLKRRNEATIGLPEGVEIARGKGRFGNALRFTKKSPIIFYQAEGNIAYRTKDWSGTVSLWLRVDPETELAPGYTDPIQITPRAWNDACFFVEFGIEKPRPFRLGAYADLQVWNPQNRKFDDIPARERPLITVERPPFSADRWTHVVFTFENFNSGRPNGLAKLYLDGELQGDLPDRLQTFTWDPKETVIILGYDYIGMLDEVALFNRALTAPEIAALHELPEGIRSLK